MKNENPDSLWFWKLARKLEKETQEHSTRIRQNKEMLLDKWWGFYLKKYKNKKYKFENNLQLREFLDKKIDWYCDHLEDNTYNEDPYAEDFLFDPKKSKKIWEFETDFHELIYDLEDYDPVVLEIENEKKNVSNTKKVKNMFISRLISTLKSKK